MMSTVGVKDIPPQIPWIRSGWEPWSLNLVIELDGVESKHLSHHTSVLCPRYTRAKKSKRSTLLVLGMYLWNYYWSWGFDFMIVGFHVALLVVVLHILACKISKLASFFSHPSSLFHLPIFINPSPQITLTSQTHRASIKGLNIAIVLLSPPHLRSTPYVRLRFYFCHFLPDLQATCGV